MAKCLCQSHLSEKSHVSQERTHPSIPWLEAIQGKRGANLAMGFKLQQLERLVNYPSHSQGWWWVGGGGSYEEPFTTATIASLYSILLSTLWRGNLN